MMLLSNSYFITILITHKASLTSASAELTSPIKNTEKERGSQVPDTKSKYDNNA